MLISTTFELDELKGAMWELKNDKSMGPDGLLVKFYKQLWNVVRPTYYKMCQEAIHIGGMERL
jgi:hypothetical protein